MNFANRYGSACGLRRTLPLLIPLLAICSLLASNQRLQADDTPAADDEKYIVYQVWNGGAAATDLKAKVSGPLTESAARKLAEEMQESNPDPERYQYMALPASSELPWYIRWLGHKAAGWKAPSIKGLIDYAKTIEADYRRAKDAADTMKQRTQRLGEDEFNKVNAQIDDYNKLREVFRAKSGYYPPGAPPLVRLRPGDLKVKLSPPAAEPQPASPTQQLTPYKDGTPYKVPPEFKNQFNPRLDMVDTPKAVPAPKGVLMRLLIERGSLQRAEAPNSLIADIGAGNK